MSTEAEDTQTMADLTPEPPEPLELTPDEQEWLTAKREMERKVEEDRKAMEKFLNAPPGQVLSDSFMRRVNEKVYGNYLAAEAIRKTQSFQQFFTLTAQINEAAHDLAIKTVVLDVENGEVTTTYRTRPRKTEASVLEEAAAPAA